MIFGLKASEFTKNAFTLSKGTLISQVLLIVATPILTRLYTPEDFGELALFVSLYSILSGIFSLKFELAIILPKEDSESVKIMKLTLMVSLFLSSCFLMILILLKLFSKYPIPLYLIMLPFLTFICAVCSVMQHWFSRKKAFYLAARSGIINSAVNISICFGLYYIGPFKNGQLLIGYFLGFAIATFYLTYYFIKQNSVLWNDSKKEILALFKKYNHFPRYMVPTAMLGILSFQIIPLLLKQFFSIAEVGYYSMSSRFLYIPSILVGAAIGEVFRVELAKQNNEGSNLKPLFLRTLIKMLIIGCPTFLSLFFLSPYIFKLVLGSNYYISGVFSQYLCFAIFGQFLIQPFNNVFIVKNRISTYFIFQLVLTIIPILTIISGSIFFNSIKFSLISFSIISFIVAIFIVFVAYNYICQETRFSVCK